MPAEFGPHAGCWIAWPTNDEVFGGRLDRARAAYAGVAKAVSGFEPVTLLVNPPDAAEAARMCGPGVRLMPLRIDDSWTRDTGPSFVVDGGGGVAGVDWRFNGWGEVWPDYENDALMAAAVIESLGMRRYEAGFVLEGGAIHVDGEGTLMAVAPCLLDPNRNPGMSRLELEGLLADFLGVTDFIWLEHGLENDETAGHVDNVACFARPGLVLLSTTSDPQDGNYEGARDTAARLKAALDARGRKLEVIEIEQPGWREGKDGRMAMSYINFYLPEGGVVMPSFDDPNDEAAFDVIRRIFPDRRVIQLPALDIVYGGGGIHCITQQQPAGRPLRP